MYIDENCETPGSVVGAKILDGHYYCEQNYDSPSSPSSNCNSANDLSSDQLVHLFARESSTEYSVSPDYLHSCVLLPPSPRNESRKLFNDAGSNVPQDPGHDQGVSERCRRRTCEWMYDICDYFQLHRDVVAVALHYVDRYFTVTFGGVDVDCEDKPVTRRDFQLVALTSLYIAIKLHGESRTQYQGQHRQVEPVQWNKLKFNLSVCASISRHQFTPSVIEECECRILSTLKWHVNPIVPSGILIDSLVNYFPSSLDPSIAMYVYDCAKYLAELSVSVPALSLVYIPSVIAYASILYSMDTLKGTSCEFSFKEKREYEQVVHDASNGHFDVHRAKIVNARNILEAICPNLQDLFPTPSASSSCGPSSPTSVKGL
mmetsp:Transcript_21572/g.41582  ORF Transcript_21572/g.41582 Transcript_21572/m.41582 type:complete len:374 (-) Transcript_21572:331-1452(-)